jgi:hypothetical protein
MVKPLSGGSTSLSLTAAAFVKQELVGTRNFVRGKTGLTPYTPASSIRCPATAFL